MLTNNELTYELCCCSSVFHTVIPSVQALKASEQYAKLLGHQNTRQKIMHVKKLKDDNASLKQVGIRIHVQYMQYFIVSYLSLLRSHSYGPIELALVPFEFFVSTSINSHTPSSQLTLMPHYPFDLLSTYTTLAGLVIVSVWHAQTSSHWLASQIGQNKFEWDENKLVRTSVIRVG